jgi:hypothetical protein
MPPDSARAKAWAIANERLDLVEPWDKIRQRVAEIDIESDTNEVEPVIAGKDKFQAPPIWGARFLPAERRLFLGD